MNLDSPSSPPHNGMAQRITLSPERTISPINSGAIDTALVYNNNNKNQLNNNNSPKRSAGQQESNIIMSNNSTESEFNNNNNNNNRNNSPLRQLAGENNNAAVQSPLHSLSEKVSPKSAESKDQMSYIQSEFDALEREQAAIDLKANVLEGRLRDVMGGKTGG